MNQGWLEIDQVVFEKFSMQIYYSNFYNLAPYLNKYGFQQPKDVLCQVWLKLTQWIRRKKKFQCCQCVSITSLWRKLPLIQGLIGLNMVGDVLCPYSFTFSNVYFSVIYSGEGPGFTLKKKLNPLHPKCFLKKLVSLIMNGLQLTLCIFVINSF